AAGEPAGGAYRDRGPRGDPRLVARWRGGRGHGAVRPDDRVAHPDLPALPGSTAAPGAPGARAGPDGAWLRTTAAPATAATSGSAGEVMQRAVPGSHMQLIGGDQGAGQPALGASHGGLPIALVPDDPGRDRR